MKGLWIAALIFFMAINSLAAVLYAGVPSLDGGEGFISLSPLIDCVFWGCVIVVSGIMAVIAFWRARRSDRLRLPRIPERLRYPAAYLVTLADLSTVVLLLGILGILDRFSGLHLPFWGYVGLMSVLYLVYGCFMARVMPAPAWTGLVWAVVLLVFFGAMGGSLLHEANVQDAYWKAQAYGTFIPAYTQGLMDSFIGAALGRLNLPACVLMDAYSYARYENLGGVHTFSRDTMTLWVCLCPVILFTVGWLAGCLTGKRGNDHARQDD